MIRTLTDDIADFLTRKELVEFIKEYGNHIQKKTADEVVKAFEKHKKYGTCYVLRTETIIIGIARWNMLSEKKAMILDVIIKKNYRSVTMLKTMIEIGFEIKPTLERIIYERGVKGKPYKIMEYTRK